MKNHKLKRYIIEKYINFIFSRLFCCNHTCYCVGMVSVTSGCVISVSHYQSRSAMYIRGQSDSTKFHRIGRGSSKCLYWVHCGNNISKFYTLFWKQCRSHWYEAILFITINFCMLGNFSCFCCRQLTLFKLTFWKIIFRNTIRVSNGLDPDQDRHVVDPDLGPNCLHRQQMLPLARKELNPHYKDINKNDIHVAPLDDWMHDKKWQSPIAYSVTIFSWTFTVDGHRRK